MQSKTKVDNDRKKLLSKTPISADKMPLIINEEYWVSNEDYMPEGDEKPFHKKKLKYIDNDATKWMEGDYTAGFEDFDRGNLECFFYYPTTKSNIK